MLPLKKRLDTIITILKEQTASFTPPLINQIIQECGKDPFLILIACLLSLRAKDTTTIHVCRVLFKQIRTPRQLLSIPLAELEKIVFRTGYYKTKARVLHEVSRSLLDQFDGQVPQTYEELISIKGVGPKTANLVVSTAFDKAAICVDTHVHRISNHLGIISTKTVEQSEQELKELLPKKYWTLWNYLLVMWGQNICIPVSPKCTQCPINAQCKRVGVMRSR